MRRKRPSVYTEQELNDLLSELEEWRIENKLSRSKLAKKIGLRSYVATYYWYKGVAKPYPRHVWRIVQILDKRLSVEKFNQWQKERIIK